MKKIIVIALCALTSLFLLGGCMSTAGTAGGTNTDVTDIDSPAVPSTAPDVTPEPASPENILPSDALPEDDAAATPEQVILPDVTPTILIANEVLPNRPFLRDLDGAGEAESVNLIYIESDDPEARTIAVTATYADGQSSRLEIKNQSFVNAYEYIDSDGKVYMLVVGDYAASEYEVSLIKLDGLGVSLADTLCGRISSIDAGIVYVEDTLNLLGTNTVTRVYRPLDGALEPLAGSLWTFVYNTLVTPTQDVTLDVIGEDGKYVKTTVKKGSNLMLVATDRDSFINVILEDGRTGVIEFVSGDDGYALINGVSELVLFEGISYAE